MLLVTSTDEAMARRRQVHVNGKDYTLAEFVGAAPKRGVYEEGNEANDNGLPQGFLVFQPPNAVTPAHFHEPNQFQVFVDGGGRIGAKSAAPLTVQYANGHTPYGPIVADGQGITYFTLRQRWDPGAKYLPASREKLRKGNQRTRVKGGLAVGDDVNRIARTAPASETVFAREADGLHGLLVRAGADQVVDLPGAADGGGQYLVVAAGSVIVQERELPKWSTVYITPEESAPSVRSGPTGLDLLVLQFPRLMVD